MSKLLFRRLPVIAAVFVLAICSSSAIQGDTSGQTGDLSLSLTTDVETNEIAQSGQPGVGKGISGRSSDEYRVDTGDGISVTVYGEADLSIKDERVKGNGTISYPLLGGIEVRGLTAPQLRDLISRLLADGYLKKPNVTVSIDTYRMFFIKGEVRNPGGYNYQNGLTVEKAVALAGGFTERASEKEITVVRDNDPEQEVRAAKPTTRIAPGDVVTVGESFF
jgi:polysaccharide export outer membrane protein